MAILDGTENLEHADKKKSNVTFNERVERIQVIDDDDKQPITQQFEENNSRL